MKSYYQNKCNNYVMYGGNMKLINFIFIMLLTSVFSVFAQEVPVEVTKEIISNSDLIELLIKSVGGAKGASTLAIVGIAVKFILAFFNSELGGKAFKGMKGSLKLLIVTGLTMVSGVVSLMSVNGLEFGAAMIHSATLSAFLVFGNQVYKQFIEKKD